ncbi:MAG: zinc-binding dehydrogenase [Phycisphaerae bacterium]
MKAAVIHEHGEIDRIRIDDIPEPTPGPGEVLVDVKAAALNHLDVWVRIGGRASLNMPHVLGCDASGVVSAVDGNVQGVRVGDEVILDPGLSCGYCEFCRAGEQSLCTSYGIIGLTRQGTFAEKVAVPAVCTNPKPVYLTFEEAAALPLARVTAYRMLVTRAKFRPGETVLIHGIGGGVAIDALQLTLAGGGVAIVTSSHDWKLDRAREMGAQETINYATEDVAKRAREITGGRGVDICFDTVGAATFQTNFQAVRKGGRIVHCGVTTGASAEINIQALYWNQISLMGSTMGSRNDFREMLALVSATHVKPVIDSVGPLEDVAELTARMEAGDQFGKLVLKIAD